MLERFKKIQTSLNSCLYEITCTIQNINSQTWKFITQAVIILEPFKQITKDLEQDNAYLSQIQPAIYVLKKGCATELEDELPVITKLRKNLLDGLQETFKYLKSHDYIFSTMLDPRYRFSTYDLSYANVQDYKKKFYVIMESDEKQEIKTQDQLSNSETQILEEKMMDPSFGIKKSVWDNLKDVPDQRSFRKSTNYNIQLEEYLKDFILPYYEDPLQKFWDSSKRKKYSTLVPSVKRYFGIPPTSSSSERVFSIAGNIVNLKRTRLSTEHVNQLVFLNRNLSLYDKKFK